MKLVDKLRRIIPKRVRIALKERTTLSYLIAPLYGYILLPRFDGTAKIYGRKKNSMFIQISMQ